MPAVRAAVVLLALSVGASLVACGDDVARQRASSDVADGADADDARSVVEGCVVRDGPEEVRRVVRRGDTLSGIAREVYGDAALWREIVRANPEVVAADGSVRVGDVLRIPFEGR